MTDTCSICGAGDDDPHVVVPGPVSRDADGHLESLEMHETVNVYYVWRSDDRKAEDVKASTPERAADRYALRHRVPYGVALRVVDVRSVMSFGVYVKGHESDDDTQPEA